MIMLFFAATIAAYCWWVFRPPRRIVLRRVVGFAIFAVMAAIDTEWNRPDYWLVAGALFVLLDFMGGKVVRRLDGGL